jgi:uncharacterized membrane protein
MARHAASVIVDADVHDVYRMWTNFLEIPRYLSHVRSISYINGEKTRWVVDIVGRHEFAARNENWIPDRQIGWRSIDGLQNSGLIEFVPSPRGGTEITVIIEYTPPAGLLGRVIEGSGAGKAFEERLRSDLERFAIGCERPRRTQDDAMQLARQREGRGDTLGEDARHTQTLPQAISSIEPFDQRKAD